MAADDGVHLVLACVHPIFLGSSNGNGSSSSSSSVAPSVPSPPGAIRRQVDAAFVERLRLFRDEGIEDAPMMARLATWCANTMLPPEASAFLASHRMQTLLWAMIIPLSWLEQKDILASSLAMWHPFESESHAADCIRLFLCKMVTVIPAVPDLTARSSATLAAAVRAAAIARIARDDADLVRRVAFSIIVPESMRDVACLLVRLGVAPTCIPHYVLPRKGKIFAARMDVQRLIARLPQHAPGLAFEREFANAVYGDQETPCLHLALVFCAPHWADEFKLRGVCLARKETHALLNLHANGFGISPKHAVDLLCMGSLRDVDAATDVDTGTGTVAVVVGAVEDIKIKIENENAGGGVGVGGDIKIENADADADAVKYDIKCESESESKSESDIASATSPPLASGER